jgi:hypothetical protein
LEEHNAGKNPSTARFTPWLFANVVSFRSKQKSLEFERYLQGGSGRAFIRILERSGAIAQAEFTKIHRQRIPELRDAIEDLSKGRTGEGSDKLDKFGAIQAIVDDARRLDAIAEKQIEAFGSILVSAQSMPPRLSVQKSLKPDSWKPDFSGRNTVLIQKASSQGRYQLKTFFKLSPSCPLVTLAQGRRTERRGHLDQRMN